MGMEFHDTKDTHATQFSEEIVADYVVSEEKAGTISDQRDMVRLGKRQELRRNFRFISIFGFVAVLMCSWEAVLYTASYTLLNGGFAGTIWIYVISVFGFGFAILSMAEMASMAPTSGGQYHWVSEFSPKSAQKILSFLTGWLCVLGWQSNIASGSYLLALQIQGVITLNDANYDAKPWHGTLMTIGVVTIAIIFNTFFARKLPLIEGTMLVLHMVGFFAIVIPLWILSPRQDAAIVFTTSSQVGHWPTIGLAWLVGMTGPIYALLGADSAVHMSEEIRDASRIVPLGMIWALILNGTTGFVMVVTFAFCLKDLGEAVSPKFNFTFIDTFFTSTGSFAGATVMTCLISAMTMCSTISVVATASRQLMAFARDSGVPFANFFKHVQPGWDIPINAILVSFVITCLLSLINLGSSVAFNAIVSLGVASLLTSYIISIGCVAIKRLRKQELPPRRWSLGSWGLAVNIAAICYLVVAYVFAFFPIANNPEPSTMNWSSLIYGAVIMFSLAYFFVFARHVYVGPVVHVRKDL